MTRLPSLSYGGIKAIETLSDIVNKDYPNAIKNGIESFGWLYSGTNSYLIQSCDDKTPRKNVKVLENLIKKTKSSVPIYTKITF